MKVGVVGATGFVGRAVVQELLHAGVEVVPVRAPRLETTVRDARSMLQEVRAAAADPALAPLDECDAVVNAAGAATPGGAATDSLFGGNSLLPGVLASRAGRSPRRRLVHVSSAAVHGAARVLDEHAAVSPTTAYARSKLIGEELVYAAGRAGEVVVYRPTSVQGLGRGVTESLVRVARSRLASVRGRGDAPTPQALVENVAHTVSFLVSVPEIPSFPVLHPWEGLTTESLLRGLGAEAPLHVPGLLADALLGTGYLCGRLSPGLMANVRRLDMLWRGQSQNEGWLDRHGPRAVREWTSFFAELDDLGHGSR